MDRRWLSHPSLWEQPGSRTAGLLWKWLGSASLPFLSTPKWFLYYCTYSGSFPTCPSRSGTMGKQGICLVYLCTPGVIPCWLIHLWHSIHTVNEWMWMHECMNEWAKTGHTDNALELASFYKSLLGQGGLIKILRNVEKTFFWPTKKKWFTLFQILNFL